MNVIYDLSILGAAEKSSNGRAGIYRVVENLARALKNSGRCSIHFSAVEGDFYDLTLEHLLAMPEYRNFYLPSFSHSKTHRCSVGLYSKANERVNTTVGITRSGWKCLRKLARHAREFCLGI